MLAGREDGGCKVCVVSGRSARCLVIRGVGAAFGDAVAPRSSWDAKPWKSLAPQLAPGKLYGPPRPASAPRLRYSAVEK